MWKSQRPVLVLYSTSQTQVAQMTAHRGETLADVLEVCGCLQLDKWVHCTEVQQYSKQAD